VGGGAQDQRWPSSASSRRPCAICVVPASCASSERSGAAARSRVWVLRLRRLARSACANRFCRSVAVSLLTGRPGVRVDHRASGKGGIRPRRENASSAADDANPPAGGVIAKSGAPAPVARPAARWRKLRANSQKQWWPAPAPRGRLAARPARKRGQTAAIVTLAWPLFVWNASKPQVTYCMGACLRQKGPFAARPAPQGRPEARRQRGTGP